MTDNNYKLTLIFYKSNKAPYTNVIAIFSDQQKKKQQIKAESKVAWILELIFGTKSNSSLAEPLECSWNVSRLRQGVELKTPLSVF